MINFFDFSDSTVLIKLKNKYILVSLVSFFYFFILDNNNIFVQIDRFFQINKIDKQLVYYKKVLVETEREAKAMKLNPFHFERFVRENYLLKRNNEELFVFVEE